MRDLIVAPMIFLVHCIGSLGDHHYRQEQRRETRSDEHARKKADSAVH
jgi:hypothetical protein